MGFTKVNGSCKFRFTQKKTKVTSIIKNQTGLGRFLKARLMGYDEVIVLEGQGSAMLYTFVGTDALIYVPDTVKIVLVGEVVELILL